MTTNTIKPESTFPKWELIIAVIIIITVGIAVVCISGGIPDGHGLHVTYDPMNDHTFYFWVDEGYVNGLQYVEVWSGSQLITTVEFLDIGIPMRVSSYHDVDLPQTFTFVFVYPYSEVVIGPATIHTYSI